MDVASRYDLKKMNMNLVCIAYKQPGVYKQPGKQTTNKQTNKQALVNGEDLTTVKGIGQCFLPYTITPWLRKVDSSGDNSLFICWIEGTLIINNSSLVVFVAKWIRLPTKTACLCALI